MAITNYYYYYFFYIVIKIKLYTHIIYILHSYEILNLICYNIYLRK